LGESLIFAEADQRRQLNDARSAVVALLVRHEGLAHRVQERGVSLKVMGAVNETFLRDTMHSDSKFREAHPNKKRRKAIVDDLIDKWAEHMGAWQPYRDADRDATERFQGLIRQAMRDSSLQPAEKAARIQELHREQAAEAVARRSSGPVKEINKQEKTVSYIFDNFGDASADKLMMELLRAFEELQKYNASGGYTVYKLWDTSQDVEASVEATIHIVNDVLP